MAYRHTKVARLLSNNDKFRPFLVKWPRYYKTTKATREGVPLFSTTGSSYSHESLYTSRTKTFRVVLFFWKHSLLFHRGVISQSWQLQKFNIPQRNTKATRARDSRFTAKKKLPQGTSHVVTLNKNNMPKSDTSTVHSTRLPFIV